MGHEVLDSLVELYDVDPITRDFADVDRHPSLRRGALRLYSLPYSQSAHDFVLRSRDALPAESIAGVNILSAYHTHLSDWLTQEMNANGRPATEKKRLETLFKLGTEENTKSAVALMRRRHKV